MGIYRVKQTDTSTWCHRNQSCFMRPRICLFVCAVSCLKGTVQYIENLVTVRRFSCLSIGPLRLRDLTYLMNFQGEKERTNIKHIFTFKKGIWAT